MHSVFKSTLILHGPGGTGKTMLARSILKLLGIKPLIVSEINNFKQYDYSKHKEILINALDVESLSRLKTLNIVDLLDGKSIKVLYGVVSSRPLIPRIITTNRLEDFTRKEANELLRRLKVLHILYTISSKFNLQMIKVQQQNNYHFGNNLGVSK